MLRARLGARVAIVCKPSGNELEGGAETVGEIAESRAASARACASAAFACASAAFEDTMAGAAAEVLEAKSEAEDGRLPLA